MHICLFMNRPKQAFVFNVIHTRWILDPPLFPRVIGRIEKQRELPRIKYIRLVPSPIAKTRRTLVQKNFFHIWFVPWISELEGAKGQPSYIIWLNCQQINIPYHQAISIPIPNGFFFKKMRTISVLLWMSSNFSNFWIIHTF